MSAQPPSKEIGKVRWKENLYKICYNLVYFAPNQAEGLFIEAQAPLYKGADWAIGQGA